MKKSDNTLCAPTQTLKKTTASVLYFNSESADSTLRLKENLLKMFSAHLVHQKDLIILCIGSDRSTGDSLGPLIGSRLERYHIPGVSIIGTLNNPVHAANLEAIIDRIYVTYQNPFVLAVDASLGVHEHIGYITLSNGPLRPGLGVKKELPSIGDIHITGIVNLSGLMESLLLQSTRLSKVMHLADVIARSILFSIMDFNE